MARQGERWLNVGPLKGHNSSDNPLQLGEGWATDTLNIVLEPSMNVAVKRKGSTIIVPSPATHLYLLARFLPPHQIESQAELWMFGIDSIGVFTVHRQVGAGAVESIPVPATLTFVTRVVQFNGKLFMAGLTTINRLHCWDGQTIRLVGCQQASIPTVLNSGTGTYPATLRYYKVSGRIVDAIGRITAQSESSPTSTFTPSGSGSGVSISPVWLESGTTHWTVWGSPDNASFFNLSGWLPVSQTSYVDTVAPSSYSGEQIQLVGTFLPPPSVTHIITDGHRLLMLGNGGPNALTMPQIPDPRVSRVWYTPVLGTSDHGDDERIPITSEQRNFLDIGDVIAGATGSVAGASLTEIVGPMDGQIYVFMSRRTWRLIPTGDLVTPYLTHPVSDRYGAQSSVQQLGIPHAAQNVRAVSAEDEQGRPAIYFLAGTGVYRCTSGTNVQYVSYDIEGDLYAAFSAGTQLFNYPGRRQLWVIAPMASLNKTRIFVFHYAEGVIARDGTVREGWTIWDWTNPGVDDLRGGCLFNAEPGIQTTVGERQVPYLVARMEPEAEGKIVRFERETAMDGTNVYSAHVTSAPFLATQSEQQFRVGNAQLTARALANTTLRVSATRDFGTETRMADVSIAPSGSETHVIRTVEGLFEGDVTALQITVGDAAPQAALWEVDFLAVPATLQEPR